MEYGWNLGLFVGVVRALGDGGVDFIAVHLHHDVVVDDEDGHNGGQSRDDRQQEQRKAAPSSQGIVVALCMRHLRF